MTNGERRVANGETSAPAPDPQCASFDAQPELPAAWQPLTPRGVAAFSRARLGRLFFVQAIIAGLTAGAVVWFLATAWFPVLRQAIRQLPDTGSIVGGRLATPRESVVPLAENRFIAFFADTNGVSAGAVSSDLRIGFHHEHLAVCSILGCVRFKYPASRSVAFNRADLEPWWGAWQTVFLVVAGLAVVVLLFGSWLILATLYGPVAWMVAYLKDRQLTMIGAWKLAAAGLLPGALLVALGIVFYSLGVIDLLRFLILWALHFPFAWACLFASTLAVPRVGTGPVKNPFTDPESAQVRPSNPFAPSQAFRPK